MMLKAKARTKHVPGQMNGWEREYADLLRMRQMAGEIVEYRFEAYKLKIGDNCFYRPDFFVLMPDGSVEFHEVKGFMRDDAAVKIKAVAESHWWFVFRLVRKLPKKDGGGWRIEVVGNEEVSE